MIKTEFFDDNYNTVKENHADIIIQTIFDDKGNLQKKIEWTPKKKSNHASVTNQINDDEKFRFLSQDVKNHYLENVLGMQRAIDLLWRYNSQVDDPMQKQKFLHSITEAYHHMAVGLSNLRHVYNEDKDGCGH